MNTTSVSQGSVVVGDAATEKRGSRKGTTGEDVRNAARQAREQLIAVEKSLKEAMILLEGVSKEDANFSTRESLSKLLTTLDDVNVKNVVKEVSKVVKARLVARANEE